MGRPRSKVVNIFTCDYCSRVFSKKFRVQRHILNLHIMRKPEDLTCYTCNIIYKTNGFLQRHMKKVHNIDNSEKKITSRSKPLCHACQITFDNLKELKFHIREIHFNLLAKVPYLNFKKVNQIWFENVVNSKKIVEIKKVRENVILIRKLDDNTAMTVREQQTEVLDLRDMYPTKKELTVL